MRRWGRSGQRAKTLDPTSGHGHWEMMRRAIGYLWASPNTLAAVAIGLLLCGRFRWVQGVIEIDGPWVRQTLNRLPIQPRAMTVGHVVFGTDLAALTVTRAHERVHVRQYERWGPAFIPVYLGWSLWLQLRGRDGYRENPFEVEAYAVDTPGPSMPDAADAESDRRWS